MVSTNVNTDFPHFKDGDVSILVSTSRIYRLHSHVLRRVSPYFEQYLDPLDAPRLTAAARREGYTTWRFQLFSDPHHPNDVGQFIRLVSI